VNKEMQTELDRHAETVAALTEAICGLPAVATLDWPDLAADCLASIGSGSIAIVQIATIGENGAIQHVEATGAASAAESTPAGRIAGLRARADRMVDLDLPALHASRPIIVAHDAASLGGDGRQSGIGQIFADIPVGGALLGAATLGDVEPGRALIAVVAPTRATLTSAHVAQLRAVLPLLVRRALLAIGPNATSAANWLTEREQQVLDQLALGKSVRQIADAIGRSPHTVHDHVKSLHRKLNASSRGELIARALGHVSRGVRIRHRGEPASEITPKATARRAGLQEEIIGENSAKATRIER